VKEPRIFHIGNSREKLMRVLSMLSSFLITEKDDIELEVRPRRKEKTHEQRKTWHALLTDFGKALGYTMPQMKEVVKREIFGSEWIQLPNGKRYEVIPSSEAEDRYGYAELIDHTLRIAAEQGVLLEIKSREKLAHQLRERARAA
jgi:hypothetical protein